MSENPNKLGKIWRNSDGTFKKGHPQSSDGRPKGKTLKEYAREYLESLPDEEKTEYLASLPADMVWRMAEGNPAQDMTSGGEKIQQLPIYAGKSTKSIPRHNSNPEDIQPEQKD